jgi:phosphohistidine phosphatase SixA
MENKLLCPLRTLIVLILAMVLNVNQVVVAETKSAEPLVAALQSGGHIIYMRHSVTQHAPHDLVTGVLGDCSQQRNLSAEGRALATMIANKITQLAIPIGQVYSSPYCRTKETAQLTFKQFITVPDLAFSLRKDAYESKRLGEQLRSMMLKTTLTSDNTVFVGHTSNLRDGLGVWPKPEGVWVIFKKTEQGINYLGMITPSEWADLPLP